MIGTSLSHYKITAELGRGGMGIVYRATDTKLNRDVALKILPAAALASEEDRARFFREAQAAAQLHHPNIATVFEIDEAILRDEGGNDVNATDGPRPYIAMEFVSGETLQETIKKAPLKLADAINITSQVAEALKAAHTKEIVHRDIKSANVMITEDGIAKVLDFGLAKTNNSTMLTRMGSTLGTVTYMSPEQARGQEVDGRSDLYSLGTMMYEMICGQLPFAGEYEQAVVYGILNETPDPLTSKRTGVPMQLEWIVNKLLAKEADYRYQSAAGLLADLMTVDISGSGQTRRSMPAHSATEMPLSSASRVTGTTTRNWALIAVFTALVGLAGGYFLFHDAAESQPLQKVTIELEGIRNVRFPLMSPTNEYLLFGGSSENGLSGLFLRDMADGRIFPIENSGPGWAREAAFSPSGDFIAFTTNANGGVFTVVMPTGIPVRQTEFGRISYWENEESFIFIDDKGGGKTYRKTLGEIDPVEIGLDHGVLPEGYVNIWRFRLPGTDIAFGHSLLRDGATQIEPSSMTRVRIKSGESVEKIESPVMNPAYVEGGFVMYQQRNDAGELVVRPIDRKTGDFTGLPERALSDENPIWGEVSVANNGDLLYLPNSYSRSTQFDESLRIVDVEDESSMDLDLIIPSSAEINDIQLSPDESRAVFSVIDGNRAFIALYDLEDESMTQLTFLDNAFAGTWSPDGRHIYFNELEDEGKIIVRKMAASPQATSEIVMEDVASLGVSPDGSKLIIAEDVDLEALIARRLSLVDLSTDERIVLEEGNGGVAHVEFSPDGKYVAYQYFNEGRFVIRVASANGFQNTEIADIQGGWPRWSADGSYLYLSGMEIRRIPVRTNPSFSVLGEVESVYSNTFFPGGFDIFEDGSRTIQISSDVRFQASVTSNSKIVWLQNWSDHLEQRFDR